MKNKNKTCTILFLHDAVERNFDLVRLPYPLRQQMDSLSVGTTHSRQAKDKI